MTQFPTFFYRDIFTKKLYDFEFTFQRWNKNRERNVISSFNKNPFVKPHGLVIIVIKLKVFFAQRTDDNNTE